MALSFNSSLVGGYGDSTGQNLRRSGAVLSGGTATFAAWMYLYNATDVCYGPCLYNSGGSGFWHIRHAPGEGWGAVWYGSEMLAYRIQGANSTVGWHHVVGVFPSNNATIPTLYVDGSQVSGNTQTGAGSLTVDMTSIQIVYFLGNMYTGKGINAENAIWNVELTQNEILSLYYGFTPLNVRKESLVAYWPLGGKYPSNGNDYWKNSYNLTAYNSPVIVDHRLVRYPKRPSILEYTYLQQSQVYFGAISFDFDSIFNNSSNINIYSSGSIKSNVNTELNSQRIISPSIILSNISDTYLNSNKVIIGTVNLPSNSLTSSTPHRIISPHITLNNENNLSSVGSLLIDETSALFVSTKITPQSQKIIQSVSDFLTSSELTSSASTTVYSVLNFIQENNLTVIPSLVFNSQFTGSLNSSLETATQRVLNNSIFISGNNTFSTLSSLIISGLFGPNTDSILDSSLVQVDTGEILYGEAVFQTLTRLGLSPSLLMNETSRLASNSISNMDSARIILPAVELSVDTNTSTICSSIVSGITQLKAFSNLDVLSQRVISGNFNTSSDSLLFGSFNRIVSADLEYKLVSDFLTSSTRIQGGTLVLSNETSVDSDGFRIINGVLIYEADASLLILTGQTFYNSISFENSSKFFPSIVKLTIVPITLKIAKTYESSLKINREKEIQLKIRKEYT